MISSYPTLPITADTFVGVPTAKALLKERLVRANADGDITFNFDTPVTVPALTGQDFVVSGNCPSITATISVMMS